MKRARTLLISSSPAACSSAQSRLTAFLRDRPEEERGVHARHTYRQSEESHLDAFSAEAA